MLEGDGEELEGAAQGFLDHGSDKPTPARSTSREAKWCDSHPVEEMSRASNPENQVKESPGPNFNPAQKKQREAPRSQGETSRQAANPQRPRPPATPVTTRGPRTDSVLSHSQRHSGPPSSAPRACARGLQG